MTGRRLGAIVTALGAAAVATTLAGNAVALRRDLRIGWLFAAYDMFSHPMGDPALSQLRLHVRLADGREVREERVYALLPVEHFRVASLVKEVLTVGDVRAAESFFRMVTRDWGRRRLPINQVWRFPRRLRGEELVGLEIVKGSVRLFGPEAGQFTQEQVSLRYTRSEATHGDG